MGQLW